MLRTYVLSFAELVQGTIDQLPEESIQQAIILAPSLHLAQEKLLKATSDSDPNTVIANVQFTDQCREICENDLLTTTFEGWLA